MRTKAEIEQSQSKYGSGELFTLKATPQDLIVRCVSIRNRQILNQLCSAIGLNLNTVGMKVVYSQKEWQEASQSGNKCYMFCSMQNFKFVGNNNFVYATGPVHRAEMIYKDIRNNGNALIVLDYQLDTIPDFIPEKEESHTHIDHEDENYLYHPAKVGKNAKPPQTPVYNAELGGYTLKCSRCGQFYLEKDVSYTYSNDTGYTYTCKHCSPSNVVLKKLSYKEQLAKLSHTDLDEYSFDGRKKD